MTEPLETWVKVGERTPSGTVVFHVTHLGMVKTRTRSEVWGATNLNRGQVLIDGHVGPVSADVLYEQCRPENAGRS